MEASAEVRRQRRRTATRDRRTEDSRHEVRREAEAITAPEVKNRFLAEAVTEASSVKTSRTADTVTFVEVEAEANERRGGKGDSAWKFDKSKWISLDNNTRCHIFVSKCVPAVLTFIGESWCQICFCQKWIFTYKFHFVVNCSDESLKASFGHLQQSGLHLSASLLQSIVCPGWIEFSLLIVRMV